MNTSGAPSRSLRILLVDDQPEVRHSVGEMLRRLGHVVESVADGASALDRLRRDGYDLLVTDLGMPVMNGLDLARRAKAITPVLPIVLLTGWSAEEPEPGVICAVIPKPITLRALGSAILSAVSSPPVGETMPTV